RRAQVREHRCATQLLHVEAEVLVRALELPQEAAAGDSKEIGGVAGRARIAARESGRRRPLYASPIVQALGAGLDGRDEAMVRFELKAPASGQVRTRVAHLQRQE